MSNRGGLVVAVAALVVVGGMVAQHASALAYWAKNATTAQPMVFVDDTPSHAQTELTQQYYRMCAEWRADSAYEHGKANIRPVQREALRDLDHAIATRCTPRGL